MMMNNEPHQQRRYGIPAVLAAAVLLVLSGAATLTATAAAVPSTVKMVTAVYYDDSACNGNVITSAIYSEADACQTYDSTSSKLTCPAQEDDFALVVSYSSLNCIGTPASTSSSQCANYAAFTTRPALSLGLKCQTFPSNALLKYAVSFQPCNGKEFADAGNNMRTYALNECIITNPEAASPALSEMVTMSGNIVTHYRYNSFDCTGVPNIIRQAPFGECAAPESGGTPGVAGVMYSALVPGAIGGDPDPDDDDDDDDEPGVPTTKMVVYSDTFESSTCSGEAALSNPLLLTDRCVRMYQQSFQVSCEDDTITTHAMYENSACTGSPQPFLHECILEDGKSYGYSCKPIANNKLVLLSSSTLPCTGNNLDENGYLNEFPIVLDTCSRSVLTQVGPVRSQKVLLKGNVIKVYEFDGLACSGKAIRRLEAPLDQCLANPYSDPSLEPRLGETLRFQAAVTGVALAQSEGEEPALEGDKDDDKGSGSSSISVLLNVAAAFVLSMLTTM